MATKLFLRSTQNNGIGATYFDMVSSAGSGTATAVVNSAASGTEIQWTQTAGGSVIQFVSGRAPAGGFTLTSTDISVWVQESNAQANCGGRYRVFKRAANGVETELGGGPFNDGVEFGTSAAEMLWTGNVTDTAFAENDRILLKVYITNVGTMGSGRTCTLTYNGADASTGDSFFNIAETVSFKAETTSHAATGDVTGQIGSLSGSARRFRAHASTGVITGPGSTVSGSSARVSPSVSHAASGALAGQGSAVAGSSARARQHASGGVLVGAGSSVAGSAARTRAHATSGILAGIQSAVAGSAARQTGAVTHAASGALTGQPGSVSGGAARLRAFGAIGALSGAGSAVAGSVSRSRAHDASGSMAGQEAELIGSVARLGVGPVNHETGGEMLGEASSINGLAGGLLVTHRMTAKGGRPAQSDYSRPANISRGTR